MSSGQEATCNCAGCVAHRGGTWEEVTVQQARSRAVAADVAEADAYYAELKARLDERAPA